MLEVKTTYEIKSIEYSDRIVGHINTSYFEINVVIKLQFFQPGNIFFSLEGQIKVGDFGLVKDVEGCPDLETTSFVTSGGYSHTREVGVFRLIEKIT